MMDNETILFNQEFYSDPTTVISEVRLILWTKFVSRAKLEVLIKLNQRVAFRYVTVKLIECDKRQAEMNDEHPSPNIDIKHISFYGEIIPASSTPPTLII